MCEDAGQMLAGHLATLSDVTDLVSDHIYTVGYEPDGPGGWGIQCIEIDADRFSRVLLRTALVQVTVFSIDRDWNREVSGIVLRNLARFSGYMGTKWVTVSHENEIETSEQIGAVYRWAYSIDMALRYK